MAERIAAFHRGWWIMIGDHRGRLRAELPLHPAQNGTLTRRKPSLRHPAAATAPSSRRAETSIEPVSSWLRLTTRSGAPARLARRSTRAMRRFPEGYDANDCKLSRDHQSGAGGCAGYRAAPRGRSRLRRRRSTPSPSIPMARASPASSRWICPPGDNTLVAKDFPMGLDPSSLRVEGEAGAKLTDRRHRRASRRARCRRSTCPSIDKRIEALKDQRDDLQGAHRRGQGTAQIRRALCRGLAGRHRREGRGAADQRMARGVLPRSPRRVATADTAIRDATRKQREHRPPDCPA